MEITFSIVGTAGRKDKWGDDDGKKLSINHFKAMCIVASELMDQFTESGYTITHLVSGGAAWADHVAVKLFLDGKAPNLRLFLPCEWDSGTFKDLGIKDWKQNPGGVINYYHRKFQLSTGINSLTQIELAKGQGAELIPVMKGFFARNALVAKSDFILACTFGNEHQVKDGGTANTIECYLNRVKKEGMFDKSFHYDLNSGKIFVGCTLPPKREEDEISSQLMSIVGQGFSRVTNKVRLVKP